MPTKEEIKLWMKECGHTRQWLADQCLVTKKHVDNWFTRSGKIPEAKLRRIQILMQQDKKSAQQHSPCSLLQEIEAIALTFLKDDWIIICKAAELKQITPKKYIEEIIIADSHFFIENHPMGKQEIANLGLPSHAESTDPASQQRTTGKTLGVLRLGTDPGAKRKSGSA